MIVSSVFSLLLSENRTSWSIIRLTLFICFELSSRNVCMEDQWTSYCYLVRYSSRLWSYPPKLRSKKRAHPNRPPAWLYRLPHGQSGSCTSSVLKNRTHSACSSPFTTPRMLTFEYAVEENNTDGSVTVKYARAHEFTPGRPANIRRNERVHVGPPNAISKHMHFWLQIPSEHVMYNRQPCGSRALESPPLRKWTSARPKQSSHSSKAAMDNGGIPRLAVAMGHWYEAPMLIITDTPTAYRLEPFFEIMPVVIEAACACNSTPVAPETSPSRGTLMHSPRSEIGSNFWGKELPW